MNIKKRINGRGFTLIELLAVIIVLAIIMIFAIPAVLNTSNSAQQKSFQLYAERILSKATEYVETQKMLNGTIVSKITDTQLQLNSSGYKYCVVYNNTTDTSNSNTYTLTLYITNGNYCYSGVTSDNVSEPTKTGCPAINVGYTNCD